MRPNYLAGALLSARDLTTEQEYRLNRLRRHDRFAHGAGVVCGLSVYAAPERLHPWTVGVCPGYAVGPCGDEVEVPSRVLIDIRTFFWSRPAGARVAYVGLRYVAGGLSGASCGGSCSCGCESDSETPGESQKRIVDGFSIDVVWEFPQGGTALDLCGGLPAPCPATPTSAYLILAAVRLPVAESAPLSDADIVDVI